LKICHVITRLIIGGAQENTILTCRGLAERGHEVTLIAGSETGPEGSLWPQAEFSGCRLIRLDSMRRAVRPMADWRARRELVRLFRQLKPDVVHTHSSKAGILGRSAARLARVPVIIHTIHGMSFNRTQPAHVRWAYRFLERRAARYTTGFIAVADAMIEQAVEAGLGRRDKFVTIRSGLDTGLFAPKADVRQAVRARWGIGDHEVVVGTVARLFENKGYDEIIAAMPQIVAGGPEEGRSSRQAGSGTPGRNGSPRIHFVWIGDGKHRARYEGVLAAMGLRERVTLLGLLPPEEAARQMTGFDIVLHASRWEGLPRALVQGLLLEAPAVSFDNDGAPEVVVHDQTGMLAPYGHTSSLAAAVVRLARDRSLRQRLGSNGRARCLQMFDWRKMVDAIEQEYRRLTDAAIEGDAVRAGAHNDH
jgi:glycosyltransferase involved in cell wall biosynthesis